MILGRNGIRMQGDLTAKLRWTRFFLVVVVVEPFHVRSQHLHTQTPLAPFTSHRGTQSLLAPLSAPPPPHHIVRIFEGASPFIGPPVHNIFLYFVDVERLRVYSPVGFCPIRRCLPSLYCLPNF